MENNRKKKSVKKLERSNSRDIEVKGIGLGYGKESNKNKKEYVEFVYK